MKFTIKRSKWYRGHKFDSLLMRGDGSQCCVGQMCSQLGVRDADLLGRAISSDLPDLPDMGLATKEALSPLLDRFGRDLPWVVSAYVVNDDAEIGDDEREPKLAAIAAAAGHELVFID